MTVDKANDFTGQTPDTVATTSNSGASGNAMQTLYAGSGCSYIYTDPGDGNVGMRQVLAASGGGDFGWNPADWPEAFIRFSLTIGGGLLDAVDNMYLGNWRNSTNSNSGAGLRLDANKHVRLLNRNGFTYPWVSTLAIQDGVKYQYEHRVGPADSEVRIYDAAGTLLESSGVVAMNPLLPTNMVRWGASGSGMSGYFHFDDLAQSADDWIGPIVSGPTELQVPVWDGSAWVPGPLSVWDGADFVPADSVLVWDGGAWV